MENFGWVITTYVVILVAGVCGRVFTGRADWEIVLLVMSTFGMTAVYLAMFDWQLTPFTMQIVPLSILSACVAWTIARALIAKRTLPDSMSVFLLLMWAVPVNVVGLIWTYGILHSNCC